MGLLSLFDRVNGKRGSADFCRLEDHDVVVLVDGSRGAVLDQPQF